jgi:RND family efflux transporter MFP subunit
MTRLAATPLFLLSAAVFAAGCSQDAGAKAELPTQIDVAPRAAVPPAISPSAIAPSGASNSADSSRFRKQTGASNGMLRYTGTFRPFRKSTLGPLVSGEIVKVHVREGDVVEVNAPIVSLDRRDFELRLEGASAGLEAAQVQLTAAERDRKRMETLLKEKAVTANDFDQLDTRLLAARAAFKQAEVGHRMAQKALADSVVRAPFAGVVVKRLVSEGEYATHMPMTNLATIEEVSTLELIISVPEGDVSRIAPGMPAKVHVEALGSSFESSLRRVVGTLDPNTHAMTAVLEVPNPDGKIRPGMFARVEIEPRAIDPGAEK